MPIVWALTAKSGREFQQLTRRHANENSRALFLLLGLTNLRLWPLVEVTWIISLYLGSTIVLPSTEGMKCRFCQIMVRLRLGKKIQSSEGQMGKHHKGKELEMSDYGGPLCIYRLFISSCLFYGGIKMYMFENSKLFCQFYLFIWRQYVFNIQWLNL